MFTNTAILILSYYLVKNKVEIPIIIPLFFILGNFISIFLNDNKNFLHFIANLSGLPLTIENFTSLLGEILLVIYLLYHKYFNENEKIIFA